MAESLIKQRYKAVDVSKVLDISRSLLYKKKHNTKNTKDSQKEKEEKDKHIIDKIKQIIEKHPFWGYRRVWAYLNRRENILINKKKVLSLMRKENIVQKQKKTKEQREYRSKPKADKPNQFFGIDMTKFMLPSFGWIYLVVIIDWYTKKILSCKVDISCKTELWLNCLDEATLNTFEDGTRDKGLKLISDNGSQPTSRRFKEVCNLLDIQQLFTTYDNPKGNADTERVIRTIKEEVLWIQEFDKLEDVKEKMQEFVEFYNNLYVHSSLGYKSPKEYEDEYNTKIKQAA